MKNAALVFRESEDEPRPGFEPKVCEAPKIIEVDMSLPFGKLLVAANCSDVDAKIWSFVPKKNYQIIKKQWWALFEAEADYQIDECDEIVERLGGPLWKPAGTRQLLAFAAQADKDAQRAMIVAPRSQMWLKFPGRTTLAETHLNLLSPEAREEKLKHLKSVQKNPHWNREYDKPLHEDPTKDPYALLFNGGGPVRRLCAQMARGKFPKSMKILGVRTVS